MKRLNKASLTVFVIVGIWLALLFVSPFLIKPHTVEGLDAGANRLDYTDTWDTLPPVVAQVYWFGDFNCHQKEERSYILNDNQLAVCARDVGMFLGLMVGAFAMIFVQATGDMFETGIQVIPKQIRKHLERFKPRTIAILLFGFALMPTAIDGFTQLLTSYESTNPVRLISGAFMGWGLAVAICAMLESALAIQPRMIIPEPTSAPLQEKDK